MSLLEIIDEAERKGFTRDEIVTIQNIYKHSCAEYYQRIYKPDNEEMRKYASEMCHNYMRQRIDEIQTQGDGFAQ